MIHQGSDQYVGIQIFGSIYAVDEKTRQEINKDLAC